jgi:hypothetical protein
MELCCARGGGLVPAAALRDWRRVRVRGDGSCLWHALAAALGDERIEQPLRRSVVAELREPGACALKRCYACFWAPGEEGTEAARDEASYLRGLMEGSVCGGDLELLAASRVLRRTVAVLDLPARRLYVHAAPGAPLFLVRQRMHYDALRRA